MYSAFFHLYPAVAEVPPDCLISKLKQLGGRSKCLIKRQTPNPTKSSNMSDNCTFSTHRTMNVEWVSSKLFKCILLNSANKHFLKNPKTVELTCVVWNTGLLLLLLC